MAEQPPIQKSAQQLADEVAALAANVGRDEAQAAANAAADLETRTTLDKVKDQMIWVCSGFFLLGAGVGYVIERIFA